MATLLEQIIGMEKQAAIDLLHSRGHVVRIAMEDGVNSYLQGAYAPGRYNITIVDGKVTSAEEG